MTHLYWVALKSIWAKEINRFMRIWVQTLVPPVITMTLYFIIFGNLIGSRIGEMHGFTYMQFIVPGLIMMAVITNAYANVASSFFSAKFQRNIEELLVAPVPTGSRVRGRFVKGPEHTDEAGRVRRSMDAVIEIEGGERPMLGFETLTLAPIDRRLIVVDMLSGEERAQMDAYHARVLREIGPLVDGDVARWLAEACAPL